MYKDDVKQLDFEDIVPVTVDLRAMKKIQWLLYNMTRVDRCDLFNEANRLYEAEINSINNSIAKSKDAQCKGSVGKSAHAPQPHTITPSVTTQQGKKDKCMEEVSESVWEYVDAWFNWDEE